VVLAHGGRFDKESWSKQAGALVSAGFLALAIDFRGEGKSRGPRQDDPPDQGAALMCWGRFTTCAGLVLALSVLSAPVWEAIAPLKRLRPSPRRLIA